MKRNLGNSQGAVADCTEALRLYIKYAMAFCFPDYIGVQTIQRDKDMPRIRKARHLSDLPKMNEVYIFVFTKYVVTFDIWTVDVLAVVVQMVDSDGTESAWIFFCGGASMPQAAEGQFMASVQNFIIETEQIVSFRKFARLDTHSIRMEDASMDQGWQHGPRMAAWTSRGPACILNTRSSTAFDYFPWHGGRTVRMRNRLNWARVAARTHGCRSNYIPPHSTLEHLGWLDGHTAPLAKTGYRE